ncbi:MAG: hypothetical protein WKF73_07510 [Nocardioidaceae bacterium]
MTGDRGGRRSHLRAVEVIKVSNGNASKTAESTRLFDVDGREDEAIRVPDRCVAQLHEPERAEAALEELSAVELLAALDFRRLTLTGEPA